MLSCSSVNRAFGVYGIRLWELPPIYWPFQVQFVRYRRRPGNPHPWRLPVNDNKLSLYQKELTRDNQAFLEETVIDKYQTQSISPLKDGPWQHSQWTVDTWRTGVLALKIGVVPQWTKSGQKFFTTMFQVLDNHVIRYIPPEEYRHYPRYKWNRWTPKYGAVVVGALSMHPFQYTKAYCGLFTEAGLPPKRQLTCFPVSPDAAVQPGTPLYATHFRVGDYVDVQAKTIEHGFQGVVRRWGFKGGPASHGTTKWHRRPGNIGCGRDQSKVMKGKKMPGNMGGRFRMLSGLKIWRINSKYNVIYVHSPATPGPTHCFARIFDSRIAKRRQEMAANASTQIPMPTFYPDDVSEQVEEDQFDNDLHQFSDSSITFSPEPKEKSKAKKRV